MSELKDFKGSSPCSIEQDISIAKNEDGSNNLWCAARNNATNAWYCNATNGNVNTTNTYNGYRALVSSELQSFIADLVLEAENDCYINKHHSKEAAQTHYHLSSLILLVNSLINRQYKPLESIRFVLSYPVCREIYAAQYQDRVVHHLVSHIIKRVSEYAHTRSGNTSHGNRLGYSAHTAALQIRDNMYAASEGYTKECFVMTYDISGFFMNINKEKCFEVFMRYYNEMPKNYDTSNDPFFISLIKIILMNDSTKNCINRSREEDYIKVPYNKRLKPNLGLPIGVFPSQLLANLFIAFIDEMLDNIYGLYHTRFVDDNCNISQSMDRLMLGYEIAKKELNKLGLSIHPKKLYIQPYYHGVNFCGRTIKMQRVYVGNRTVRACKDKIRKNLYIGNELKSAKNIALSVNSYFGIFSHCAAYNIQKNIAIFVLERFGKYLYFKKRKNQLVCCIKREYDDKYVSLKEFNTIIEGYYETCKNERWHFKRDNNCHRRRKRRKTKKRGLQTIV